VPGGRGSGCAEFELRESSCHPVGDPGHCPIALECTGEVGQCWALELGGELGIRVGNTISVDFRPGQ
jgi:hypothetical protein